MSRSMLLVYILIIFVITCQFEWREELVVDIDPTPTISQKELQVSEREIAVKEKMILSQEKKIQKLHKVVQSLQLQLLQCESSYETTKSSPMED